MHIDLPASAVWTIYEELGSWPKVATFFMEDYTDDEISPALVWKVAHGKSSSVKVQRALWEGGFIDHVEVTQPVPVCPACGEVHQQFKSCPSYNRKDTRKTRAWHGSPERAEQIDVMVSSLGFPSLSAMIDHMIDANIVENSNGRSES